MKNLILAAFLIVNVLATEMVYSTQWHNIDLTVNDIEHKRGGNVCVYVFLEEGFPIKHDQAIKTYCLAASGDTMQFKIQAPDSPFAIKVLHDEDASNTVTKDWTGFIPAEGLGFSSGARLGFGPPSFDDAVMHPPADGKARIMIHYP